MNEASRWRYAIIQELAAAYAQNPHVAAVIVSGSTARGHADRYSDVELGVFWHHPPTDDDRQTVADTVNGDLLRLYPYDPVEEFWADAYMLGRAHPQKPRSGVSVEVGHSTTEYLNRTFDEVLLQYDPEPLKQNFIAGIMHGIPLHDAQLVRQWQARAASYPPGLALAVVRRHAQIDHFWRAEMWLARGDNLMMLYHSFTQIQQQLLHVLLGLNHVYYFGFKWLDVVVNRLELKPVRLLPRLRRVYQVEPTAGAHDLAELVEETYDLIEEHLPDIDVDWLRRVFRYRRPLWDRAPPHACAGGGDAATT